MTNDLLSLQEVANGGVDHVMLLVALTPSSSVCDFYPGVERSMTLLDESVQCFQARDGLIAAARRIRMHGWKVAGTSLQAMLTGRLVLCGWLWHSGCHSLCPVGSWIRSCFHDGSSDTSDTSDISNPSRHSRSCMDLPDDH